MTNSRSIGKPAQMTGLRRCLMAAMAVLALGVVALPSAANAQAYVYPGYYYAPPPPPPPAYPYYAPGVGVRIGPFGFGIGG
jgi:hypothetical protein